MAKDDDNKSSDYRVGYKKPPRQTQFKPGQSGNPQGRPKGHTSPWEIISKLARRPVPIKIEGNARKIPIIEAIVWGLMSNAMNGNVKSTQLVFDALQESEKKGNYLPELLQQFRAIHDRHAAADKSRDAATPGDHKDEDE